MTLCCMTNALEKKEVDVKHNDKTNEGCRVYSGIIVYPQYMFVLL